MAALCAGGLSWYGFTLGISEPTGAGLPLLFGGALPLLVVFIASTRFWLRLVRPPLKGKLGAFLDELADWSASPRVFALLAFVGILPWCVYGASLSLLVSSELSMSWSLALRLTGVLAASWVLGFITVIVPAGLGVRDVTLMALLKPILPAPMPVVIPLLLRLAWIIADLLNMLLAIAITSRFGHKGSSRGRDAVNR